MIYHDAGWSERVAPGGAVRFRVVNESGLTSASWIVWSGRSTDDVYVAGRQSAGWIKASLHASGVWQHGVVQERADEIGISPDDRLFARWTDHPEGVPGWTQAVEIVIPDNQLRVPQEPILPGKVREIPTPGRDLAVLVEVWIEAAGSHDVMRFDNSLPIGVLDLAGGGTVWVVGRSRPLPWNPTERFAEELKEARGQLGEAKLIGPQPSRIVVHGVDAPTGTLMLFELAVDDDDDDAP